jgi:hypothetical protein
MSSSQILHLYFSKLWSDLSKFDIVPCNNHLPVKENSCDDRHTEQCLCCRKAFEYVATKKIGNATHYKLTRIYRPKLLL